MVEKFRSSEEINEGCSRTTPALHAPRRTRLRRSAIQATGMESQYIHQNVTAFRLAEQAAIQLARLPSSDQLRKGGRSVTAVPDQDVHRVASSKWHSLPSPKACIRPCDPASNASSDTAGPRYYVSSVYGDKRFADPPQLSSNRCLYILRI